MKATILSLLFTGCLLSLASGQAKAATNKTKFNEARRDQIEQNGSTKKTEYCVSAEVHASANSDKDLSVSDDKFVSCAKHFDGLQGEESAAGGKNFERTPLN